MPSYVFDRETQSMVDRDAYYAQKAARTPSKTAYGLPMPYVRGDLPAYKSPVTGQTIEGRAARREDLARTGCREVDPSEYKPIYRNYEFCQRHQKPYMGGDIPPPLTKDERMAAKERRKKQIAAENAVGAKPKEE